MRFGAALEILDWTLVFGRRHLEAVLREYVVHYNEERPHRSLNLGLPVPRQRADLHAPSKALPLRVGRRDRLGGVIREYYARAA